MSDGVRESCQVIESSHDQLQFIMDFVGEVKVDFRIVRFSGFPTSDSLRMSDLFFKKIIKIYHFA